MNLKEQVATLFSLLWLLWSMMTVMDMMFKDYGEYSPLSQVSLIQNYIFIYYIGWLITGITFGRIIFLSISSQRQKETH